MTAEVEGLRKHYLQDKDPARDAWSLTPTLEWVRFQGPRMKVRIVRFIGTPREIAKAARELRDTCPLKGNYRSLEAPNRGCTWDIYLLCRADPGAELIAEISLQVRELEGPPVRRRSFEKALYEELLERMGLNDYA